jgi:RNA polymerase sigma-70 factor (sigma-E family)
VASEHIAAVSAAADSLAPDSLVAELFASEARSLVRLAAIFCDDREAAEDLVQEAFVRLHRSAHRIHDPGRAPAFLRSIVINLAKDANRRGLMSLRHRPSMVQPSSVEHVEADAIDATDREMLDAVRSLPERQRACLALRFYSEMSESEIAEALGISKNSVKTHCRRGLAALETAMSQPSGRST